MLLNLRLSAVMMFLALLSGCSPPISYPSEPVSGSVFKGAIVSTPIGYTIGFWSSGGLSCSGPFTLQNVSQVISVGCFNGETAIITLRPERQTSSSEILSTLANIEISDGRRGMVRFLLNQTNSAPAASPLNPRMTSIFMGQLPRFVGSDETSMYAVDVFRYGCEWSIAYRNKTNETKQPVLSVVFTEGNVVTAEEKFSMPSTLSGDESRNLGVVDVCRGTPSSFSVSY
jgi:hypothetical protein